MTLEPLTGAADDFAAFVEPHLPTLTWLAACLTPGEHEDVVQRALTRAWHRRRRFEPGGTAERVWLCRLLIEESARMADRPVAARPSELLAPLTAGQRRAVDCHYLVGLAVVDTADVQGCPVAEVESTLSAARLRLHRAWAAERGLEFAADDPDRILAADRRVDTLLRRAGAQFRAEVPPTVFEQPSPRMSMLGRRARLGLVSGIAVIIVGVVVAGTAIARQSATPSSGAAGGGSVAQPTPPAVLGRPTPTPSTVIRAADVGPAAEVAGTRPGWPSTGLITATASAPGAAGGVRVAWEVATGELVVGIPERLLCNDKQIRLRPAGTGAVQLDLYGGVGADQGCTRDSLRVVSFAPLRGQNDSESVVSVTGTTGALVLPGLSGLELDPVGTGFGLPSVSSVRTIGTSPDVDVQWQPGTGRLLVSARGCGAFATADLGNGTEVTVVIRPTDPPCPGPVGTVTHVIQIPPHPPGAAFQVVVYNNTADRSGTTDVFSVPATLLSSDGRSAVTPVKRLVDLSVGAKELTGVDRIGRSADNALHFEIDSASGGGAFRAPTAQLMSDQLIVLSRGTEQINVQASPAGTLEVVRGIPPVSDVHRPLLIRIGDEEIVLPAVK